MYINLYLFLQRVYLKAENKGFHYGFLVIPLYISSTKPLVLSLLIYHFLLVLRRFLSVNNILPPSINFN